MVSVYSVSNHRNFWTLVSVQWLAVGGCLLYKVCIPYLQCNCMVCLAEYSECVVSLLKNQGHFVMN